MPVAFAIIAGCLSKIVMVLLYNNLINEAMNAAGSEAELIKQIKLRYTNQIKLNLPINDIEKFVTRYIYQYSKIIKTIRVIDILGLIGVLSAVIINFKIRYFDGTDMIIALFLYIVMGTIVEGDKKERIAISYITDYLSNNVNNRNVVKEHRQIKRAEKENPCQTEDITLEQKQLNNEKTEKKEIAEAGQRQEDIKNINQASNLIKMKQKHDEEKIIEEVLKEYLL